MEKKVFNIGVELDADFVGEIERLKKTFGPKMAELNGFADYQMNYTGFIDNFIDKNTADASIDGNANVHGKDIVVLENEMAKPHMKLLSFNKLFYEMKKKWGLKAAQDWLEKEWDGHLYLHDAFNSTFVGYCWAGDVDRVAREGLFFFDNGSHAPKHLTTFTDFLCETVSYAENRSAGAFGMPSALVWMFYFWRKDCEEGYFVKDADYYRDQEFQRFIYKLNQPYLRSGIQSAFTNISIFDRPYFESLFGGLEFPDGTFAIDFEEEFIEFQKAFMEEVSRIRKDCMMTFPVLTYSLLRVDGKFVDEEFARWACAHNQLWGDSNFYVSDSVDSLSSCCRMRNAVFGNDSVYFNSIGGSGLNVGSVKVNTVNLARCAYESNGDVKMFLKIVYEVSYQALQLLDVQRHIIQRNVEKGLLPNYSSGLVDMSKQYSTLGIASGSEAIQFFGMCETDQFGYFRYTSDGLYLYQQVLAEMHRAIDDFRSNQNVDYQVNMEQIPGERAAAVLMQKDMLLYPNGVYDLPLYGNQWIPLAKKATIQDRTVTCGLLDKACNGGSIEHINVESPITDFDTAWELLNWVADQGVNYFAFCYRISTCKNNHSFYGDICPICGEPVDTTWQRVVGFLTPVKSYSKERNAEFKQRDWMDLNRMEDLQ